MTPAWRPWLYFGPAALIAGGLAVALTATSDHEQHPGQTIALVLFVSSSFILAGLIGWTRRPWNRTGTLMVAVGFGVLIGVLGEANHPIPFTLGALFGSLFIAAFVHLLLAYPSGRLLSRRARILVGAGYTIAFLAPLAESMFAAREKCKPHACPDNLVLVSHDHAAHVVATTVWTAASVVLFAAVVMLLLGRWRETTPGLRRILRSVYLFGGLSIVLLAIGFVVTPFSGVGAIFVSVALIATFTTVPFIFLAGLLGTAIARGAGVGAIFSSVPERASPGEVQEGLRNALRDETAVVAYWYEEDEHYVDVEGNRLDLPEDTRRRVVTRLDYGDQPVAAIVHDAALLQEPELLEGVANAARIALERDKLLVEVRARAQRYRALLQAMPDLMFRISRDGRYISYNAPNERDLVNGEVVGRLLWDRLPTDLADRVLASGRAALGGDPSVIEYYLDFEDGSRRHYEGRFAASGDDEFLMIVREITERKQQQEELEASRQRIVAAGDAARRKLERNLHDGAQQRLVSLSLSLRLAQNQVAKSPVRAEELLEASREELMQALEELRELARGIHPAVLTDRGLEAALEALAGRAALPVEIDCIPDVELPPPVEAAAYYVVSEALANITKYAGASAVKVTIGQVDGYALVEVVDDGVGGADPGRGSGLSGLSDRVASLNGKLVIDSPPGAGTRIRAEIPLE
ncbi:MAG TPA: histidine kinase [Gaiellaceae bacterium]|nr:histidine kinase [Gaiellaceae bacterium]